MTRLPLLFALILSGCGGLLGGASDEEIRVYVHTVPVEQLDLSRTLKLTGTVEAGRSVALLPEVSGKIVALPFQVGEAVHKGDVVARLDVELLSLQVSQADAAVKLAQLGVETAETALGRARALRESGSLTPQQFEQAESGHEVALLQAQQAAAGLGLARHQRDSAVLRAPFDGRIGQIAAEEGAWFSPMAVSPYAPGLVTVVDLDTVKVDLQVTERDVVRLGVGGEARVMVDAVADRLPPEGLLARVATVGVSADPASRTFPVRVVADNPDHALLAGTHARVGLVLEGRPGALVVPEAAILGEDALYVVTVSDGVATRVPVQVGLYGDQGIEVIGDLAPGAEVAVRGHFGLLDGAAVEVVP
ncbi:MAG: efflux RND transporter periplasmic adaptor subunit [Deltaproteobacteria bacterium]|nr:efflux RND transporter periplasmic adaptor subunit [Deltaproteobacteria bacterium]